MDFICVTSLGFFKGKIGRTKQQQKNPKFSYQIFVKENQVSASIEERKKVWLILKTQEIWCFFQSQVFLTKLLWWSVVLTQLMLFPGPMQTKWWRIYGHPPSLSECPPLPSAVYVGQRENTGARNITSSGGECHHCLGCGTDWQ